MARLHTEERTMTQAAKESAEKAAAPDKAGQRLSPLLALVPYGLRYRGRILAALGALVLASAATLAVPFAVRQMIDFGFSPENAGFIDRYFEMMLVVAAVLATACALRYYLVITLGERVVADLRAALFAHVIALSPAFYDRERVGEIVSRLTADTSQIKSAFCASASIALRNLLLFLGGVAVARMVGTSPPRSALALIAIPLIVLPLVGFGRMVTRRARAAQDTLADASAFAVEAIGSVRTVQALTGEDAARKRFGAAVERSFVAALQSTSARAWLTAAIIFLVFASIVGVLWTGAQNVLAGKMTAGKLSHIVRYAVFAAGALSELSQVWNEINQTAGAAGRIAELLSIESEIRAPARPMALAKPARGEIRFEDVSFAYPTRPTARVLDNISFSVRHGERVAVVGPSGAGKSTLFHLLLRFYDPLAGKILFDGVDLSKADPQDVRRRLALVPQDVAIFAMSIRENIRLGRLEASDGAGEKARRVALVDA